MNFKIGQKVVCVNASPGKACACPSNLTEGAIYTVSGFSEATDGDIGVIVAEAEPLGSCLNPQGYVLMHVGWLPMRFRPLIERKADMEARQTLFNDLLKTRETVDG